MSYHAIQSPQQKSLGLFIVFAFHAVVIVALINGLGAHFGPEPSAGPIKFKTIEPKVAPPPALPSDPDPKIVDPVINITPPPVANPTDDNPPVQKTPSPSIGDTSNTDSFSTAISKPFLKKATRPDYPVTASRLNEEGTTGLQLYITEEGRVAEAQVFATSGSSRLDDAAIKHAQRNWAFKPCTQGDKPVACWYKTNLVWRLEDAKR